VLCLNDNMPLVSALTNDFGFEQVFVRQLETWWEAGDVALGVSVHGGAGGTQAGPWSRNVLAALRHANDSGGSSLGLMGFDGGAMRSMCTASVTVPGDSTPHTEGLHAVLHHLIATALRARIERGVAEAGA
jgi:D-sedoheptulose 7-phosphate isomerase